MSYGCMCGALDCPSCGRAQGRDVEKYWRKGRAIYLCPEDVEPGDVSEADIQEAMREHAWNERKEGMHP
ncbi:hypothetical protein [Piscinibacter gummiphilus]|uniref:Uncharacterized protein n=1 Tax=Piscinibacter gummiphilus TaxID=946333 RepID=A0ABZ0CU66_9BURK|nr:hypothetical protein [Piscinibacter gummiphilus]WOB06495.1 hypothetical protein RXV79_16355 [Piscinibacter gummiphilus]